MLSFFFKLVNLFNEFFNLLAVSILVLIFNRISFRELLDLKVLFLNSLFQLHNFFL